MINILKSWLPSLFQSKEDRAKQILSDLSGDIRNLIVLVEDELANIPALPPAEIVYVVQRGDTLSKIAKQFNVTIAELAIINNISNINLIHPGQILKIPEILDVPSPVPEPPKPPQITTTRPGIWVVNGNANQQMVDQMYSWRPGSITVPHQYLGFNQVFRYKRENPDTKIIIRFFHPQNWRQDSDISAINWGKEIAGKWNEIKILDPWVYFINEANLGSESGDPRPAIEDEEFYKLYGEWVGNVADTIKNIVPEMRLITPPFAFGHGEDGIYDNNGNMTSDWAGYDFLVDTIKTHFDNVLTFHAYWGDAGGRIPDRLYHSEISKWYAFRWRKVLDLFKTRFNMDCTMIIDEAGSFEASHPDFIKDIEYYSNECLSDPRVLALTWFLWFDPTNSPGNVPNSWVQQMPADRLNDLVEKLRDI